LGGSGINYTFRLINAGFPAFPILAMGKDAAGELIRKELLTNTKKVNFSKQTIQYIDSDTFLSKNINTPRTTIIADKKSRTIFTEKIKTTHHFVDHLKNCLNYFKAHIEGQCKAVIIGHIQSDDPDINKFNPGASTKFITDFFYDRCFIFANFGDSQIKLGIKFWEEYLKKVCVFQLNLIEMRKLFSFLNPKIQLSQMIEWFRIRKINAIVTSDKLGAIGTFGDGKKGLVFAPPVEIKNLVDSTGAGDAFMAGLVSKFFQKNDLTFEGFHDAISEARIWAAYACTSLGGATNCPDRKTLMEFQEKNLLKESNQIEILSIKDAERKLKVFDTY
jgi:sugar/nucleoside kinase (ribokinase family)